MRGAAWWVLALVGGSLGCQSRCSPALCNTCCDANDACVAWTDQQCGNNGEACFACPEGQTCSFGFCSAPRPDAGPADATAAVVLVVDHSRASGLGWDGGAVPGCGAGARSGCIWDDVVQAVGGQYP